MRLRMLFSVALGALLPCSAGMVQAGDEKSAIEAVRKVGGFVKVDDAAPGKPVIFVEFNLGNAKKLTDEGAAAIVPQLTSFAGLRGVNFENRKISDSTLQVICRTLPDLRELGLDGAVITDEGLKSVAGMKKLEILHLNDTSITDEGVRTVGRISTLIVLQLDKTKVTDEGMKALKSLSNLRSLRITATAVTDAGLLELKSVKTLTSVYALKSRITKAGAAELKKTLPKVYVAGP